ncbi:hypothetical protein [Dapis sp. BLCC M172]|uniref:hypothetical protein n=1 Tax=Dapis sp. BLCC M172 TaxID=2975281 RepID=UPI003CECE75A
MAATQICYVEYAPSGTPQKSHFKASATKYTSENKGETGITPATDANSSNTPLYDTAELMRVGYLDVINVYYTTGAGDTARRGSYRMFCDPTKKQALLAKYQGATPGTINGKTITGASAAIRRQKLTA